jgi:hypothetical protein
MSVRALVCLGLVVAASATQPIPQNLLNEWSQFQADDQFYDQMNSFLETGTHTGEGDFEFKCETTCQLVQAQGEAAAAARASSYLETEEKVTTPEQDMSKKVEDAFYNKMDAFLETQSKTGAKTTEGGDFEFKCETTCQLVQQSAASAASKAAANALIQTEEGSDDVNVAEEQVPRIEREEDSLQENIQLEAGVEAKASAAKEAAKDCYRLCLNPSMNPGCDAAASVVSLLETGSTTMEELTDDAPNKNWSMGNGSGNCLNNCVHVCMAVKDPSL